MKYCVRNAGIRWQRMIVGDITPMFVRTVVKNTVFVGIAGTP